MVRQFVELIIYQVILWYNYHVLCITIIYHGLWRKGRINAWFFPVFRIMVLFMSVLHQWPISFLNIFNISSWNYRFSYHRFKYIWFKCILFSILLNSLRLKLSHLQLVGPLNVASWEFLTLSYYSVITSLLSSRTKCSRLKLFMSSHRPIISYFSKEPRLLSEINDI